MCRSVESHQQSLNTHIYFLNTSAGNFPISPPRVESKTSGSQHWLPLRVWRKEKAIIHTRGRGIRNLGEIQERGIEEREQPGKGTQEAAGKDMSVCGPQLTPGFSSFTTVIGNVSATPPPSVSSWQAGTMPQSHLNPLHLTGVPACSF